MSIYLPKITTDSFYTPLKFYHKQIKKTFKPLAKGGLSKPLLDLIKRIVFVAIAPIAYPTTIACAATGLTLKIGIGVKSMIFVTRLIRRGQYDEARQEGSNLPQFIRNDIETDIFFRSLRPYGHNLQNIPDNVLEIATHAALQQKDVFRKDIMFGRLLHIYLSKQNYDKAVEMALKTSLSQNTIYVTRSLIISGNHIKAVLLINSIDKRLKDAVQKGQCLLTDVQIKAYEGVKLDLYCSLVNSASTKENLETAIECLLALDISEWRSQKIHLLSEVLCEANYIDLAISILDRLPGHKNTKALCAQTIADKLMKDNPDTALDILNKYKYNNKG
jgi:hypothetical protein